MERRVLRWLATAVGFVLSGLLAGCGGGGGGDTPSTVTSTSVTPVSAASTFSGTCSAAPTVAATGPFTVQAGDCFVSWRMSDAELAGAKTGRSPGALNTRLVSDVRAAFKDGVDVVIVLLDLDSTESAGFSYAGVNVSIQTCSVHNASCPQFGRLGAVYLVQRSYLQSGPALHELLHGFHFGMTTDASANFIIPTSVASHWGYSSVGGQLGGWKRSSLVSLGGTNYQATGPDRKPPSVPSSGFGSFANGGNSVPYSNLELWTMGLLTDAELDSVDVAETPVATSSAHFAATAIRTYSPAEIIARVLPTGRPSSATLRAFRCLVVLASTQPTISTDKVAQLNTDIAQFTLQSEPTTWLGVYNFWSATGGRATMQLAAISGLIR